MSKLNKFGVPISDTNDDRANVVQPKFVNRFRVKFNGLGNLPQDNDENSIGAREQVLMGSVESFQRPDITFSTQEATSFIARAKYSSRPTLGNFTLVIRDDITNTVISAIYNQIKAQTYKFQPVSKSSQGNSPGTMIKSIFLGANTKFGCSVEILDGNTNHKPLEVWEFNGCNIENFNTSQLSYEDDQNIISITLQCSFDYFDVYQPKRIAFPSSYKYSDSETPESNNSDETVFDALGGAVEDTASTITEGIRDRFFGDGFFDDDEDNT